MVTTTCTKHITAVHIYIYLPHVRGLSFFRQKTTTENFFAQGTLLDGANTPYMYIRSACINNYLPHNRGRGGSGRGAGAIITAGFTA